MQFDRIISVRNNRTVFRDGELCIKVLEDDFPASFVLSEATNMVAAAEAGLDVPKLREVNLHGNKRLITYDYIVGSPILCSDRDDADFRAQRLNLLIDAQLSINGIRCPECIRNPRTVPNFRSTGTACTAHDEPNAADIVQIAFNSGKHAAFAGDKLCHGNLTPENVILSSGGELYIIDWAYAYPGTPESDAAICCLILWLTCGEQTAREYFELYLKRNGSCSSDAITTLLPFAASMLYNRENAAGKKLLLSIMK